jgi:predicted NBD/HSP70 family sugar kinase
MTGVAGYAGEIGHLPVNPAGRRCRCGSVGCWETEIGEEALLRRAGRSTDGGARAVEDVVAAAAGGEAPARAAVREVGRWLGRGVAGLVNVFNPRVVVLGGFYTRLYPHISAAIEAELDRGALAAPRANVRVAPAAFGMDAPLLGAAELAFEPFLARPADWLGPGAINPEAASA